MDRGNHYETAFEDYLRAARLGYVAVDETRRAELDDAPVKSLDFIVHGHTGARLVVDVKGRRFPGGTAEKPKKTWQSWVFRDDVDGLIKWASHFGPGYNGLIVFAYKIMPFVRLPDDTEDLWQFRETRYLFRAVAASDYRAHMRTRSPKWGTVSLPTMAFRELVRPVRDWTHPAAKMVVPV